MTAQNDTPTFVADDLRLLDQEEGKLVDVVRRGKLEALGQSELNDTLQRLRDRRDRARELANRQRREARGKADPSGVAPATQNSGTEGKARVLGLALELLTQERKRRSEDVSSGEGASQSELAARAESLKAEGAGLSPMQEEGGPMHPEDPEADPGKGALADTARTVAPSGALDHAGELPSRERSRTRY
ncbi:hypothetical protein [Pseudorhodobacter sp. MZDSW-24AT]|uniref:hypothetical protein n=1 Tax=Pseudorhodobacter sp. MZDSW-24AT TaxID=2052957 RepID=UPI000C1F73AD|nr:hypothetical protein [Pseudorhodobacter sp. MZDSW-24AT]PJF07803.1 hypothetical protein CUR21_18110 [Pseudorhodobacter sp. MZDSW-24AT]